MLQFEFELVYPLTYVCSWISYSLGIINALNPRIEVLVCLVGASPASH